MSVADGEEEKMKSTANRGVEKEACFLRFLGWLTIKLRLLEEGATPPNWRHILLIFTTLFASSCSLTYLFPFLPEMILHLGYSENEKGTYGGLIASSVFCGRIFGSMLWGWLTDVKGRKTVLLYSLLLTGLAAGLFGFSVNIPMAMGLRFACGLLNGIVGASKASLYDVSDNSNQAVGMTILSLAWGSGLVTGPLIGGFFAMPCTKWPDFCDAETSLLGKFPFLLPSLFPCVVSVGVFFLILFKFHETYDESSGRKDKIVSSSTDVDEKEDEEDLDLMSTGMKSPPSCSRPSHRLLQRSFSENKNLKPHGSILELATSMTSLNPEVEMSVCLGRGELERQQSTPKDVESNPHQLTKSHPELVFNVNNSFDKRNLETLEASILSKSMGHIQQESFSQTVNSKDHDNHHNDFGSTIRVRAPIYKPNGTENKQSSNGVILSQPKADISIDDENGKPSGNGTNIQPLLPATSDLVVDKKEEEEEEEEPVCECCDACCKLPCCSIFAKTSLRQILRNSDIWSSIILYTVLSFVVIGIDDIFPVFASTRKDYGGLGFNTNEIGMALGFVTLPLLIVQIKLYPFLVSKLSVRKSYLVMAGVCLVTSQCIPMLRVFNNDPVALWVFLVVIQLPLKIGGNCCFASTSLLINNSAPPYLTGQVNGLAMMSTAIGRTIAPIAAGSIYSWTVAHGQFIGAPFDTGFAFVLLGTVYAVSIVLCLFIRPRLDRQKK